MKEEMMALLCSLLLLIVLAGCGGGGAAPEGGGPQPAVPSSLVWSAPASNTDGSPLTDLAGYKIYYGTEPGTYTASLSVGNTTSISLAALSAAVPSPGLYYLVVSAYDAEGNESAYSNEISRAL